MIKLPTLGGVISIVWLGIDKTVVQTASQGVQKLFIHCLKAIGLDPIRLNKVLL